MGFMGPDSSRSGVDFSPPILQLDYTFLIPAGSPIQGIADADRPDVRIAVVRDHASTLTLTRIFKYAQLVYAATPDPTFELLRTGKADAFASIRAVLLAYSAKLPGSRVLDDRYGANLLGMLARPISNDCGRGGREASSSIRLSAGKLDRSYLRPRAGWG